MGTNFSIMGFWPCEFWGGDLDLLGPPCGGKSISWRTREGRIKLVPDCSTGLARSSATSLPVATGATEALEMDYSGPVGYQDYSTRCSSSVVAVGWAESQYCTATPVLVGSGVDFWGRTLRTPDPSFVAASRIEVREPASRPSSVLVDQELASSTAPVSVHASGPAVAAAESGTPSPSPALSLFPSQLQSSPSPPSLSPPVPSFPSLD